MPTVRRGDAQVTIEPGESLQTATAMLDAIEEIDRRMNRRKARQEYLRKIQHGHDFSLGSYSCFGCGLSKRDYLLISPWEWQDVCPNFKEAKG